MIWLSIVILILFGLLAFILIAPFTIRIDTNESDYSIEWGGIARLSIIPDWDELMIIRYRIFFLKESITC